MSSLSGCPGDLRLRERTCEEENRVQCFHMSADNLQTCWLQSVGTCDMLVLVLDKYIMRFVRSRNGNSFVDCVVAGDQDPIVKKLARSQDQMDGDGGGSWKEYYPRSSSWAWG